MTSETRDRVAIIGGGLAGLSCARVLTAAGCEVTIFDKARSLGGRCCTRRLEGGDAQQLSFDHGAQYFTVRDPGFAELVSRWRASGQVQVWQPRLWALDGAGAQRAVAATPVEDAVERLVAVPGMSALARSLRAEIEASALEVHTQTRIVTVQREKFDWELKDESGRWHTRFGFVVLNLPAGQVAPLLSPRIPAFVARAQACEMQPCWTLMFTPARPLVLEFDAAFVSSSPLAWVANNASKPGRGSTPCWVLQASGAWTAANFERDAQAVAADLLAAFSALIARTVTPAQLSMQRWRYAKPEPLPEPFLYDRLGIGACGDWCGGPRVEGAFVSGRALAEMIMSARA